MLLAEDEQCDEWGWLDRARELERQAGRVRTRHWGPRTLDVDVVTVDRAGEPVHSRDPELLLPHPGTPDRATVLVPWLAIRPDAELAGHGRVAELVAGLDPAEVAAVRWFREAV